jgi:hypothetical protein
MVGEVRRSVADFFHETGAGGTAVGGSGRGRMKKQISPGVSVLLVLLALGVAFAVMWLNSEAPSKPIPGRPEFAGGAGGGGGGNGQGAAGAARPGSREGGAPAGRAGASGNKAPAAGGKTAERAGGGK